MDSEFLEENESVPEQSSQAESKRTFWGRLKQYFSRLHHGGLVFALIFFCFSMLPSLLPRPWFFQGLVSGISLVIGYGIGVLLCKTASWLSQLELPEKFSYYGWRSFLVIGPIVTILFSYWGSVWQKQVHELVGMTSHHSHLHAPGPCPDNGHGALAARYRP